MDLKDTLQDGDAFATRATFPCHAGPGRQAPRSRSLSAHSPQASQCKGESRAADSGGSIRNTPRGIRCKSIAVACIYGGVAATGYIEIRGKYLISPERISVVAILRGRCPCRKYID